MKRTGVAALAVAVTSVCSLGLSSFAAPGDPVDANTVNAATITKTTASLTVHKFLGNDFADVQSDGQPITVPEGAVPLNGVVFEAYKVKDIDLSTNAGWEAANKFVKANPASTVDVNGGKFDAKLTETTAGDGVAKFADKPIGLYLVKENIAASNPVKKDGSKVAANTVTAARSFYVTLPLTDARDTTKWDYDVDVYPKNLANTVTKEVKDGNVGTKDQDTFIAGENITYTIETSVNSNDANQDGKVDGKDIGYYAIGDKLQEGLEFVSATVKSGDTTFAAETDYKLVNNGNKIVVSFTDAGLNKLVGKESVSVDVVAKVTNPGTTGIVKNSAWFVPSRDWFVSQGGAEPTPGETPPGTPPGDVPPTTITSNEVESKFGDIVIHKVNPDGKSLAGAEFALFRAKGNSCENLTESIARSTATTDGGLTKFENIQLSNWYNGATITEDAQFHKYCIVETKSPDGHELLAKPLLFSLTDEGTKDLAADLKAEDDNWKDDSGSVLEVVNTPKNADGILPTAGGAGVAGLSAVTVLLLGGAGGAYFLSRKRETVEEAAAK